jgi:23S rRNA (cytidine2498-2'-O)-methyltransferase
MDDFLFVTCQVGAEAALKQEVAREAPHLRFAYSRPGFLTFKVLDGGDATFETDSAQLKSRADQRSGAVVLTALASKVFARSSAVSLGKANGATMDERAADVWRLAGDKQYRRLHVWRRDLVGPEFHGKVVEPAPSVIEVEAAIRIAAGQSGDSHSEIDPSQPTRPGDLVLDCVIVEPDEWWVGWHEAHSTASCWPGGRFDVPLPPDAVSRAWLKMEEALVWSGLPISPGDLCAEIGSAPGGASQALLGHGVHVIGIDPAGMDPRVVAHPGFVHWKKRGADVRRREFRKVRWLTADLNVAPRYTLDTVEAIVTHPEVHVQGMILTLKLLEWSLAAEIPADLDRVRSWGFGRVAARQLHHNRREICVAAIKGQATRHRQ